MRDRVAFLALLAAYGAARGWGWPIEGEGEGPPEPRAAEHPVVGEDLHPDGVEVLLKSLVYQPDTAHELIAHRIRHVALPSLPLGLPVPPYAFPSGHAARLAFLAGLLLWLVSPRVAAGTMRRSLQVAVALVVALSAVQLVYTGEHWFTDVLGGLLLGTCLAAMAVTGQRSARENGE